MTEEDNINMYYERLASITCRLLNLEYGIDLAIVKYRIRLINQYGVEIVKGKGNRKYSKEFKGKCINRVLINGESSYSVFIEEGFSNSGILINWIRLYKETDTMLSRRNEEELR